MPTREVTAKLAWKDVKEFVGDVRGAGREIDRSFKNGKRQVKQFEQRGKKAAKTVKTEFQQMKGIIGKLGLGIGISGLVLGLKRMISETIKFQDEIGKLSTRLGESTEFLSEMSFVAERSGVSFRSLSMGIQRANRRIAEAVQGTGEAKNALEDLGLLTDLQNGKFENFEQLLPVLAERLNELSSESDKLRIAFKLFDSEGVSFLQFLKEGGDGIEDLREKAQELGLSLSQDQTDAAAEAQDAITNLTAAYQGFTNKIVTSFAPTLAAYLNLLAGQGIEIGEITAKKVFGAFLAQLPGTRGLGANLLIPDEDEMAALMKKRGKQVQQSLQKELREIEIPVPQNVGEDILPANEKLLDVAGAYKKILEDSANPYEELARLSTLTVETTEEAVPKNAELIDIYEIQAAQRERQLQAERAIAFVTGTITNRLADAIVEGENLLVVLEQIAKQMSKRLIGGVLGGIAGAIIGGPSGAAAGFKIGAGFQHGTDGRFMRVRSGTNEDSVPIVLRRGEDFMVRTPEERRNGGGASSFGGKVELHFHGNDQSMQHLRTRHIPRLRQALRQENIRIPGFTD